MKRLKLYEEFKSMPKVLPSEPQPEVEPDVIPRRPVKPVEPEEPNYLPEEPDEYNTERPEEDPNPQASKKREAELINKVIDKYKDLENEEDNA